MTLLPFRSKNCVLPRNPGFFHVPRIVLPLVEIQALPEPVTWASRRLLWLPSLSGAKRTAMTITLVGAIRVLVPASVCFFSPVTERR